jgi:hypothetical protein
MQCDRGALGILHVLGPRPLLRNLDPPLNMNVLKERKSDHQDNVADLDLPSCPKGPIPHHHLFPELTPLRRLKLDLSELSRPFLQKSSDAFLAIRKRKTAIVQSPFDLEPRAQSRRLSLFLSVRHLPGPGAAYLPALTACLASLTAGAERVRIICAVFNASFRTS